jgi:molecular chaperone GrpE
VHEDVENSEQTEHEVVDVVDDLAAVTRERDEYLDSLQRLKAEFDNYRKRTAREQADLTFRANERLDHRHLAQILD